MRRTSYSSNDSGPYIPIEYNEETTAIIKDGIDNMTHFDKLTDPTKKRKFITTLENKLYLLCIRSRFNLGFKYINTMSIIYFNIIATNSVIIYLMKCKLGYSKLDISL